jgi:heptosyltransferase-2
MAKILVIRFSSIGDIVLTTPVLRILKNASHEVHVLTKTKFAPIFKDNPHVEKIWHIDENISEVATALAKENYTCIIDLHNNLRSRMLQFYLWRTPFYRFKKLNFQKWLLTAFGINTMPANDHVVKRYIDTLKPLGLTDDGLGLDYFIPKRQNKILRLAFREGFVAIAVGATYKGKKLPKERLASLCAQIDKPIILLGGEEDRETAYHVLYANRHKRSTMTSYCGKATLSRSADILRQAKVVVAFDTGLMHIAAALQKKIVCLWGCTSPALGMYPYKAHPLSANIEPSHLTKRPCSKLGNRCKYKNWACVNEIPLDQAAQAIRRLFEAED